MLYNVTFNQCNNNHASKNSSINSDLPESHFIYVPVCSSKKEAIKFAVIATCDEKVVKFLYILLLAKIHGK